MSGKKIIRGLKEAVAGKAACVRTVKVQDQGELASSSACAAVGAISAIEREGDRLRIEYHDRPLKRRFPNLGASKADVLYYLKSILGHMREVRDYIHKGGAAIGLGSEVLSDNIDWLDCYIDRLERKRK